jgi:hypothetical protein
MKNSSDTIGNRTSDLPACSAVPQPTAPPRSAGTVHAAVLYTDTVIPKQHFSICQPVLHISVQSVSHQTGIKLEPGDGTLYRNMQYWLTNIAVLCCYYCICIYCNVTQRGASEQNLLLCIT